ncbi:hypothetical protein RHABOEDO_000916 [Candidatus Rhabdochlamydia oedothoracis]|uniref:Uncharacterized protein n=1 Tax=Candidatus Rhabdochlamydia oedothoracis TaxID=2720720 RepID=A0ABX8V2J2_9BACT|nr:hypothetical protein [Candidatus Rhabdochlamydia sp. W815]KAG6559865.1 hypothetical protein RHOW815_000136 [Candidatus Rhabdochlamydia sp. W815]QYF48712.1 hypothetical protein RHABOEDO_000916 [Candidatus Rhabdochlamydia oedothoracis]
MSHCIANKLPRIVDAPLAESRVECNAGVYTIFLNKKLEEIAFNSYKFLSFFGKKSIAIAQKGVNEENRKLMQKNVIKQIAVDLTAFALSLSYCSMNYLPAGLIFLPVWFLASKLKNCANEQIQTKEIDTSLVEDSTIKSEVLKGGILFYKAWQNVNQKKDRIFFTSSGESRFSVFESTPALEGRITQLEEKLKNLGKQWECTETDQETIEKIEELFYSNV